MKTYQKISVLPQLGIDQSIPAPPQTAQMLEGWKYDPQTKGWTNRFGWEPYFMDDSNNGPFEAIKQLNGAIDSLYVFQRHNSKQQFVLFECKGKLAFLKPYVSAEHIKLSTNRTEPTPTSPRTAYEPFGRYCIITNGIDAPVKFRGTERLFPLGWDRLPGSPFVRNLDTVVSAGTRNAFEATFGFLDHSDNVVGVNDQQFQGVSSNTDGEEVEYYYKVSFVNEAGSESPLSSPSNRFDYTADQITRGSNQGVPKVCPVLDIPLGPEGTVARRIYRTKQNGDQSLFYLVETLPNNSAEVYVDFRTDDQLGAEAPGISESIIFPAPSGRFTSSFKSCLFIDGGEMDPTRLYFSRPLQPDTFASLDFFEVGTREGGDITGLEAYYNSLLVFRENAIDLVRSTNSGGFELVPFIEGIGTWSHSCIVGIPKIGVAFLSMDGVYLISGGLDGGADLVINKISNGLDEVFERISIDAMPAAVGAYSQKERELQFWVPTTGQPDLRLGLVFHVNNGQWSTRAYNNTRCIAVDRDGNFLFGVDKYSSNVATQPMHRGIMVQSGKHQEGVNFQLADPGVGPGSPPLCRFRSQWIDFGEPEVKKFPKFLYLYVLTDGGDNGLEVKFYKDRDWNTSYDGGTLRQQTPDLADQAVYDKSTVKWGTAVWQDKRLTQIRYPISMGAVSEFAFELNTTVPCTFVGYTMDFQTDGTKVIKGKA